MNPELKPYPYCGGIPEIKCTSCGIRTPFCIGEGNKNEAAKTWNPRTRLFKEHICYIETDDKDPEIIRAKAHQIASAPKIYAPLRALITTPRHTGLVDQVRSLFKHMDVEKGEI